MEPYSDSRTFYDALASYLRVDQLYHIFPNQTAIPNNLKSEKCQIYPRQMCIQQTSTDTVSPLSQIILTDEPAKFDIIAIHLVLGELSISVTYNDSIFDINHTLTEESSVIITVPPTQLLSCVLSISADCTFAVEITQPKLIYTRNNEDQSEFIPKQLKSVTEYISLPEGQTLTEIETDSVFVAYNYVTTQPNPTTINQTIIDIAILDIKGEILLQQQMYPRHKVIDWRTPFTGTTDERALNKIDNEDFLPLIQEILKNKFIITAQLDLLLYSLKLPVFNTHGYFDLSRHPIAANYITDPIIIIRLSEQLLHTATIPMYTSSLVQAHLLRQLYKYLMDSYYVEDADNLDFNIIELNLS